MAKNHVMLSVSMDNSADLYNLRMKMYFFVDPDDETTIQ